VKAASGIVRAALGKRFPAAVLRVESGGAVVAEEAVGAVDGSGGAAPIVPKHWAELNTVTTSCVP